MADNAIRDARKKTQEENRKSMEEHREDRKKQTEAAMKRMESSQPTPTQEENDLARIGITVDEKEDDKSGQTVLTKTIVANEPLSAHGYQTRATRAREERAREAAEKSE